MAIFTQTLAFITQSQMENEELLKEFEELFQSQKNTIPTESSLINPKMEYHVLADAVYWEDERFRNVELENAFRHVLYYRTYLITKSEENKPDSLSKETYELAKKHFPNWIGFKESRSTYDKILADRISRIRKVSDWKMDKLFNESEE